VIDGIVLNLRPSFNYKTVFIFIPVPMQRRRVRPRLHRMFKKRETTTRVISINHKSDVSSSETAGFSVQWLSKFSICCVRFSCANELVK
jgi:hypothetical protein